MSNVLELVSNRVSGPACAERPAGFAGDGKNIGTIHIAYPPAQA